MTCNPDERSIYIAAPFFNPEQIERVEFIKSVLDKQGITYFSPKDEFICPPDADAQTRRNTFDSNLRAIDHCDYMIAITDGKDMGTIFEAGYACRASIEIVYFCETLPKGGQFNLMLAESATRIFTSREAFAAADHSFIKLTHIPYTGEIE